MLKIKDNIKIIVFGVGDAGCNIVNYVATNKVIDYFTINTDTQFFKKKNILEGHQIIFNEITQGLGTGGNPKIGQKTAEMNVKKIEKIIHGADVVFIIAGLGGGTGTGISPVLAKICHDNKILTIAIVTRPFNFEGKQKIDNSVTCIDLLTKNVDSLIIISNNNLLTNNGNCSVMDAFKESDRTLIQILNIIIDLILLPGVISISLADLRNILQNTGITVVGFGLGKGENRIIDAANTAVFSPLLEIPVSKAKKAICTIFCGSKISLFEAQKCVNIITEKIGKIDVKLSIIVSKKIPADEILVGIIACDFDKEEINFSNLDSNENNVLLEKKYESILNEQTLNIENNIVEDEILPSFLKKKQK